MVRDHTARKHAPSARARRDADRKNAGVSHPSRRVTLSSIDNRGSVKGDLRARMVVERHTCGVHRVPYSHDEPHVVRPGGTDRWSLVLLSQRP
jgi:proteasome lid subunit RPN8/RPN11